MPLNIGGCKCLQARLINMTNIKCIYIVYDICIKCIHNYIVIYDIFIYILLYHIISLYVYYIYTHTVTIKIITINTIKSIVACGSFNTVQQLYSSFQARSELVLSFQSSLPRWPDRGWHGLHWKSLS